MRSSRAIHRSPSHGKTLALANKNAEDRMSDPEAPHPGSPKKAEPPSYRRKQPFLIMFFILFVTFLLGTSLFFSQKASYSENRAAATAAAAKGPSIGPETAWNPINNIRTKVDNGTNSAMSDSTYVEFTAPGLFVPLK